MRPTGHSPCVRPRPTSAGFSDWRASSFWPPILLGVPARFIELDRKAAMLAYDWQRLNRLGPMPIPQPFQDDRLNMFHDAPAVLRRVRQPVLAIFGGLDTLTPPRESAAIWADALRGRGNDDYSVRLFPRGSHGLEDGGKTGSPLEFLPELRAVPGYFDTMVKWVHHHADGPEFSEARQVDVDADAIPIESRGMERVSWYGSGAVQPWHLLLSFVVFASAVVAAPASWICRRWRHGRGPRPVRPRAAANTVAGSAARLVEHRDHERYELRAVPAGHGGAASGDQPAGADLECAGGGDVAVAGPGRAGGWRLYRRVAPRLVGTGCAGLLTRWWPWPGSAGCRSSSTGTWFFRRRRGMCHVRSLPRESEDRSNPGR